MRARHGLLQLTSAFRWDGRSRIRASADREISIGLIDIRADRLRDKGNGAADKCDADIASDDAVILNRHRAAVIEPGSGRADGCGEGGVGQRWTVML